MRRERSGWCGGAEKMAALCIIALVALLFLVDQVWAQSPLGVPADSRPNSILVSVSPSELTAPAGGTVNTVVTVNPLGYIIGTVTLSLTQVAGPPVLQPSGPITHSFSSPTLTFTQTTFTKKPRPLTLTDPESTNLTLTVPAAGVAAGTYHFQVTATWGLQTSTAPLTLIVDAANDFLLVANPATLVLPPGGSGHANVSVFQNTGTGMSAGLTVAEDPADTPQVFNATAGPNVISASFTPGGTLGNASVGHVQPLQVSVGSNVSGGPYHLIVTGTSGTIKHAVVVTVTIDPAASFALSVERSLTVHRVTVNDPPVKGVPQATVRGSGDMVHVTVRPVKGFNGDVTLGITGIDPAALGLHPAVYGLGAVWYDPSKERENQRNGIRPDPDPDPTKGPQITVSLAAGAKPNTLLTIRLMNGGAPDFTPPLPVGTYPFTIIGVSGSSPPQTAASAATVDSVTELASTQYNTDVISGLYYKFETSPHASFYDYLNADIVLPSTAPGTVTLIQGYNTSESYNIYSGGVAKDAITNNTQLLDVGFVLDHTGDYGYKPFYFGGSEVGYGTPDHGGGNAVPEIAPQDLLMTLEFPGYPDPAGVIPDYTCKLVLSTDGGLLVTSVDHGATEDQNTTQTFTFSNLGRSWRASSHISVKHISSIAQNSIKQNSVLVGYNNPPLTHTGDTHVCYSSGAFAPVAAWNVLTGHIQHDPVAAVGPINFPPVKKAPGSPYVTANSMNSERH